MTELYDVAIVPGKVRPMALGFSNNDIMEFTTHDDETPTAGKLDWRVAIGHHL